MGFLVKANALGSGSKYGVVIITVNSIVFAKQPSAEIYLANIFSPVFCKLLENSFSASKNRFLETFRKFIKKTHVAKSYFSKVACFYRSSQRRCSVKKLFLEKCLQNSQKNTCVRGSILTKLQAPGCKKETLAQVLFYEFSEIFKNPFFLQNTFGWTFASAFSFSEVASGGVP